MVLESISGDGQTTISALTIKSRVISILTLVLRLIYPVALSVDLLDAVGDRLMLSGGFRRDGTKQKRSKNTQMHSQRSKPSPNPINQEDSSAPSSAPANQASGPLTRNRFQIVPNIRDIDGQVQLLYNSFKVTTEPFVAYQYFLHVVPTTYVTPRSTPLQTPILRNALHAQVGA
ncbi:hypothetical protein BDQ17DRAFT_1432428 [Cyathus striatus]|nr:hypothetical protein BDQ17DRAFT_1432428 [Cyathus striatus]